MNTALAYDPPATIAAYSERLSLYNAAADLKAQADQLCRALHTATPQNRKATKKLAAALSRDLQALRGRL